jgi:signal transduction histidine kinase
MLTALVADVQTAASVEQDDFAVQLRPLPIGALLADVAAFGKTLPGDHPLILPAFTRDLIRADPERIGQVLRNLIGNAAKYSPAGTPIEVRIRRHGPRLRFEVIDRGYGIAPEDLQRIFEKFGRGRDQSGQKMPGMGLGLYLSRRIVRAHGSDLTVQSTPGIGSVFGFDLEPIV